MIIMRLTNMCYLGIISQRLLLQAHLSGWYSLPSLDTSPGALWIIIGAVVAGAVHDMVSLFASVRYQGRSLPLIAKKEIGGTAGTVASFAVLFILILTLAGLSIS